MATSDGDLSATMLGGSDVIYDFFCEPCSTDGEHLEAAGFCKTCAVYLCTACYKAHRRSPTSRTHKLLDAATMPRTTISSKPRDVLTQPCDKHQDKVLEYFCKAHGDLCCSVCLNIDHASCKPRSYIPDISAGVSAGQEYKDIAICMDRLAALATEEDTHIARDETENDNYKTMAVMNIRSSRKEMDKLLDDAEKLALQKVDELHKDNTKKIKSSSLKCQSVLSKVTTTAADLDQKSRKGQQNQLFVGMKLVGRRLPAIEEEINQLKARKISHYKFDNDNIVQHFKSALSAVFTVTVTPGGAGIKARHVLNVSVRTSDDSKDCQIESIEVLSGGCLVVTDHANNAVKLVDVRQNKVISRLTVSSPPFDVKKTMPDKVAVALGKESKIEVFTVTGILTRTKTIEVPGTGIVSLVYDENIFIVIDQPARALKMVDMTGKVVSTVYTDSDSDPLFKMPRYIALDNDVVYITDYEANTVTCMTLRGRIIWVYKHAELKSPLGVGVGRGGDVIVCSRDTDTVQLASRSGQLVQVLLDQQRGLALCPAAISFYEDKLWVSSSNNTSEHRNYVSMFQLE